jgi:DNA-binding MurR/RpiR family transcriptional regulator
MSAPRSFLSRVRLALPSLHPAEARLGEFVADFPGEIASYSASELARLAGVSKATVSRFVRRLGYDSYEDARRDARNERETGSRLYLADAGGGGAPAALADSGAGNVQATLGAIAPETVDAIADAILAARRVWTVGFRASHPFAAYLQWQLLQAVEDAAAIPGPGQTLGEQLASMTADDVVVFFGLRRRVAQNDAALGAIAARGARLVYVTDEGAAENGAAAWHLRCVTAAPGPLFNHVSVMAVCHLIASRAIARSGRDGRRRLREIESLNESLGEL